MSVIRIDYGFCPNICHNNSVSYPGQERPPHSTSYRSHFDNPLRWLAGIAGEVGLPQCY